MRLSIALLLVALLIPAAASSQSLAPDSQPEVVTQGALVSTSSSRLGITAELHPNTPLNAARDSITVRQEIGARLVHSLKGGVLGTLAGAGIGAAIGAVIDRNACYTDAMIPATAILGIYGAIGGAGLGLVVGALWPVH